VFKSRKKEHGASFTDVLLIVTIWCLMLFAVVFALTKYQEYKFQFYMFAFCFMFVSYILVIQIIDFFEKRKAKKYAIDMPHAHKDKGIHII
jgi:bacteriorhodopsin